MPTMDSQAMQHTNPGRGERLGSKTKALLGALLFVGLGIGTYFFAQWAPAHATERFAYWQELGILFLVLSVPMYCALRFGRVRDGAARQLGSRSTALLVSIFFALFAGAFVWGFARPLVDTARISADGIDSLATVQSVPARGWNDRPLYTVEYDGHVGQIELVDPHTVGDSIHVAYLATDPSVVLHAPEGRGVRDLLKANGNTGYALAGIVAIVFAALALVMNLKVVLFGPGPPEPGWDPNRPIP